MNDKNIKTKIKNFWDKNGDKIKVGLVCGTIGLCYGTVKGMQATVRTLCYSTDEQNDQLEAPEEHTEVVDGVAITKF